MFVFEAPGCGDIAWQAMMDSAKAYDRVAKEAGHYVRDGYDGYGVKIEERAERITPVSLISVIRSLTSAVEKLERKL